MLEDTATAARDPEIKKRTTNDDGGWECPCNVGLEFTRYNISGPT